MRNEAIVLGSPPLKKKQSETEESQVRIHASSQPSSRLRGSESRRTPVSALGLIVGSVMGPINPAKMRVRMTIRVRIAAT